MFKWTVSPLKVSSLYLMIVFFFSFKTGNGYMAEVAGLQASLGCIEILYPKKVSALALLFIVHFFFLIQVFNLFWGLEIIG